MDTGFPNSVCATRVVVIKRLSKTVKSGRRFTFGALVVVGDGKGGVGLGWGKSREVAGALQKAETAATAQKVQLSLKAGRISHEVRGKYCGASVLLRPAPPGSGILASRAIRDVLECAGVKDVVTKSLGARNPANVAKATIRALLGLRVRPRRNIYPVLKLDTLDAGQGDGVGLN